MSASATVAGKGRGPRGLRLRPETGEAEETEEAEVAEEAEKAEEVPGWGGGESWTDLVVDWLHECMIDV